MLKEPWEAVEGVNPGTNTIEKVKLATYVCYLNSKEDVQCERHWIPPEMPMYILWTGGVPFAYVKQLTMLRTAGTHHLAIEKGVWQQCTVLMNECVCHRCMRHAVQLTRMICTFCLRALLTNKSDQVLKEVILLFINLLG